jgi:long-chain acyl-CoA synthetase
LIAVVEPARVSEFAKEKNLENNEELLENKNLKSAVMGSILELSKENQLQVHEKPKNLKLITEPFSVENGLLTPTMKLKRNVAKEMFLADIEKMYQPKGSKN